jgi:hypothetical protein
MKLKYCGPLFILPRSLGMVEELKQRKRQGSQLVFWSREKQDRATMSVRGKLKRERSIGKDTTGQRGDCLQQEILEC